MSDYFHSYIEEVASDIIKSMEYELTHSALNEEQEKKVIKEIMVWLLMFVWAKGDDKDEKR